MFQSYALFPHMNVEDNVGYGLRRRGVGRDERRRRVAEMLELVRLLARAAQPPAPSCRAACSSGSRSRARW